jgi:RNA polymerase sigma factor (sigma-70 family)
MNGQELARLIREHSPGLILFARQWCTMPEDVVQDAFLKLVRQRTPPLDPAAWLYRVVRNGALDAAKTARRRQQRETITSRSSRWFVEFHSGGLDADTAVAALERLPPEQREIVTGHLWGKLTFEQLGQVAGCSASTAFRRFQDAIAELRKILGVPCPTSSNS